MRHLKTSIVMVLGILLSAPVIAQYQFESKKAQKLYEAMDAAYMDYDFVTILDKEDDILKYFDAKQDTVTAAMYSFLGESHYYEGELSTSLDYYRRELELRKNLPEEVQKTSDLLDLIFSYASINLEAGNYELAEQLYLDLLEQDKAAEGKKSDDYVTTVLALADHYTQTLEAVKGQKMLRKYGGVIKKNTYEEAMALKYEGEFYNLTGEYSKGEANYLKSLEILEETGYYPSIEYVFVMNSLAILYTNKSQYPLAEELINQSLQVFDRLGKEDEESVASINFNLGQVYQELGYYEDAIALYLDILESDKEYYGDDSYYVAITNFILGKLYIESGDYSRAKEALFNAKRILELNEEQETTDYAYTMNGIMRMHLRTNNLEEALKYSEQVIDSYKKVLGEQHPEYATMLSNVAEIYMKIDDLETAEELLLDADKIRLKKLGNKHPQYALGTRKLAIVNWKKDELDKALDYYTKTFDNYFSQINAYFPVLSEEEKSKFYYNKLKPAFEQFNSFIVENRSEDKKLVELMYNYQLATKGIILYATSKVRESILNSGDASLIEKYETWIGQKEQLARLFSQSDIPAEVRNRKIDSLGAAANDLEGELSNLSSVFAQNFASTQLTWRDIQAKLKPGEAAVEIIRFRDFDPDSAGVYTDEVYYAALIVTDQTEEAPDLVIMRNGKQMETRFLANYRNSIRYQVNENFSYRLFWRPLANRLKGVNKIYFSPDGVYNQISIYTLQNPDSKKFTIDEFEIKLVTNTKDLVAFNTSGDQSSGPSYLFGYPNYDMGKKADPASNDAENRSMGAGSRSVRGARGVRGAESDESFEALTRGGLPRGIRGNLLRYMRSGQGLGLLPGTQVEVNLIDSLYGKNGTKTVVYMENDAIEERVKEVKNPQTLHIATHGFFLESEEGDDEGGDKYVSNPLLRSGLIMAGANNYIATGQLADGTIRDDGILTAYEAMNLNLDDTELVVLSACETGLGEIKNGEGVFGLQRAFQIAGADAIIMSMWSVDDAATQELMTNFYEEWLVSGDKNQAFVTAQRRLKDKWKAPYYWGAFVMVGN